MALLRRRVVTTEIEEKILTGMIVSDVFCRDVFKLISDKDIISTPYIAKAIRWCSDYYGRYKAAPCGHIKDIYESEKINLDQAESAAISTILAKISDDYQDHGFNEEYIKDRALEFIRARLLRLTTDRTKALLEIGKVEDAEEEIKSYHKIEIDSMGFGNPLSEQSIKDFFIAEKAGKDTLFKLPGVAGDFLGPFERNWLVAFLAPTKRGKTFWLLELAVQSLFSKRRVLFISLEMSLHRIRRRFYRRLTAMSDETKNYVFPVFDCKKNQMNSCNKAIRTNDTRLLDSDDKKPEYEESLRYRPCQACRGTKNFIPDTWFTTTRIEKMKHAKAIKLIMAQTEHFGDNYRDKAYPSFSANLHRVRSDIMSMIEVENFIPDVICIDYADILAPEDKRITGRDRIDETWKALKNMADELHCLVATVSQSNRESSEKKNVVQKDVSEDFRKIANSDGFYAINQTPAEKRASITRISRIATRDGDFDQYQSVICLQQLALGQVCLDSCMADPTNDKTRDLTYEEFNL